MTSIELPDMNDDDLGEQIQMISDQDANIMQQIAMLTYGCNWHEKMALATNAIVTIDAGERQLCEVKPKHGRYNENLQAAIGLLRHLSPGAKAELAVDILSDDWDLGTVVSDTEIRKEPNEPETCPFCQSQNFTMDDNFGGYCLDCDSRWGTSRTIRYEGYRDSDGMEDEDEEDDDDDDDDEIVDDTDDAPSALIE